MKYFLIFICTCWVIQPQLKAQNTLATNRIPEFSVLKINEELVFPLRSTEVNVGNASSLLTNTTIFPGEEIEIKFIKTLLSSTNSSTPSIKVLTFQNPARFRQGTKYSECRVQQIIFPKFSVDSLGKASLKLISQFRSATTLHADSLLNPPSQVRQKSVSLNGFRLALGSLTTKQVKAIGPITIDLQKENFGRVQFSVSLAGNSNDWLTATQKKAIYNGNISFMVAGGTELFRLVIGDAQLSNYSAVNMTGGPITTVTVTAKNCSIVIPN